MNEEMVKNSMAKSEGMFNELTSTLDEYIKGIDLDVDQAILVVDMRHTIGMLIKIILKLTENVLKRIDEDELREIIKEVTVH
jgi:hypothetical protein